ncbi:unnamed protein product [Adineta ricciae]|uniref:Uncharacterized protein n=1 Tax=Adineta ricciae TaxID=249248 RepID=A0A813PEG5_ADIRI|nr:unnamed protein product [Adineta ricciae]CAF1515867.1 unnamed protein product [Adineta ricciae]
MMSESQLLFEKNQDFSSFSKNDQLVLLHGRLKYVVGLSSAFLLRYIDLYKDETFSGIVKSIYGSNVYSTSRYTSHLIDSDIVLVKLVFSILIFSIFDYISYNTNKNSFNNLKNSNSISNIPNLYIELAWKYLLYEYDHFYAVKCFSNILRYIFMINSAIVIVLQHDEWTNMVDNIIKQTEENLSLSN